MSRVHSRRSGSVTAAVILARFISGRDLDGTRRTNATFTRHADTDLTEHQRASRWAHRRHAERAGIRVAVTIVTAAIAWGLIFHRWATELSAVIVGAAAAVLIGWRIVLAAIRAKHNIRVVGPAYRTVATHAGQPRGEIPTRHLVIPKDYRTNPKAEVRLTLGMHFLGLPGEKRLIQTALVNRLGHGEWQASFYQDHTPPYMTLHKLPQPPERLSLAEFVAHIDAAPNGKCLIGMGANNRVIGVNLDSDAPHVALSMGTGGGKTDTVAGIIAQLVRKGDCERIDVLDPKRISHNWARGLPGVYIHRFVVGQMDAIHNARLVMDDRYEMMDDNPDTVFSRFVLIIEEQNSLIDDLKTYWDDYRRDLTSDERSRAPKVNPAIGDLKYILAKGRQCRVNVISIYQRMSASAAGSGDMRENYGAKILARYSTQTWKMLADGPFVKPSRIPGRATFIMGDDVCQVQRVYAGIARPDGSADKGGIKALRDFALNGQPDTGDTPEPTPAPDGGNRVSVPALSVVPDLADMDIVAEAELLTLREISEDKIIPVKLSALLKARQRDPEFPAGTDSPTGKRYRPADLVTWHANRVRARAVA